jgi:hypothetical protein
VAGRSRALGRCCIPVVDRMMRRSSGTGPQPKQAQAAGRRKIRATEELGEAGCAERLVRAQQLILVARRAPSATWRRRARRGADPDPSGAPADRLGGAAQALSDVLQGVSSPGQLRETAVVLGAPAPGIADQPEPAGACGYARGASLRQLPGNLGARQCDGVAVADDRVLPCAPPAARQRIAKAELLRAQAQRVRCAPEPARQDREVAVAGEANANLLVLARQVGPPGGPSANQHPSPGANPIRRATEQRGECRRRDAGDLLDRQSLCVEPTQRPVLALGPAARQRSPRLAKR